MSQLNNWQVYPSCSKLCQGNAQLLLKRSGLVPAPQQLSATPYFLLLCEKGCQLFSPSKSWCFTSREIKASKKRKQLLRGLTYLAPRFPRTAWSWGCIQRYHLNKSQISHHFNPSIKMRLKSQAIRNPTDKLLSTARVIKCKGKKWQY